MCPDAWVDYGKTKVGYEIPINRHFYVYKPPRPLDQIEADITKLEGEIAGLLEGVGGVRAHDLGTPLAKLICTATMVRDWQWNHAYL